ncbi:hypothetical protein BDW02DRAFT_566306 [Decorospora gaudefroyi]|uniref:Uncharacterized protein n=1 Tax=Decorospora gaudefroyi TaxID=184978 RepID=A0A6A5KN28_9PLEO|nr:hypothetical protein BDW02DRAFT_566306 [Decorospora gaudefroyi]
MSAMRAFATRRTPFVFVQRAAFSQSIARTAGKESALHSENRAEEVEKKKQEHLQKQKDGKGQWDEQLASDSESIVRLPHPTYIPTYTHKFHYRDEWNRI